MSLTFERITPIHKSIGLGYILAVMFGLLCIPSHASAKDDLITLLDFIPVTTGEAGKYFRNPVEDPDEIIGDRYTYHADELHGQFLLRLHQNFDSELKQQLRIQIKSKTSGRPLESIIVREVTTPKLPFLINTMQLKPDEYEVSAYLSTEGKGTKRVESFTFNRTDKQAAKQPIPTDGIAINPHPLQERITTSWPISTGVPFPKATLRDTDQLQLLEDGRPIAAQYEIRSTWTPRGYIKWLGVDFIANYVDGKPRQYTLVQKAGRPAEGQLKVTQNDDVIEIDTGAARFHLSSKTFTGIERAWLDLDQNNRFTTNEMLIDGSVGSFLTDNKQGEYETKYDNEAAVEIEQQGSTRATVCYKGWYHDVRGERLCKYVIRITAYAGQPQLRVSHRMINTIHDLFLDDRLTNVGFGIAPAGNAERWMFSLDSHLESGSADDTQNIYLHQEKSDQLRIVRNGQPHADGRRSDGWMSLQTDRGLVSIMLRDVWQKFPNELEMTLDKRPGGSRMYLHSWPKHGRDVFTDEEELARNQVYKIKWAHEGSALNMRIPDDYHAALEKFNEEEGWAGGAELVIVDSKKNLSKMQVSGGQGTAIGSEFIIRLDSKTTPPATLSQQTNLAQQNPHALPDPAWSCTTDVLGPIAARDPQKFPEAERLMDVAYNFYQSAIIDAEDEYGKWIYGGVHNNWQADEGRANLTRVWQMCHYQNIYQAWLLYFRSGMYDHFKWAMVHSNQHLDVGVNNYTKYPPGTHSYSHMPEMGGNIYHCKGFMPYAGNSSTMGHWIDITNYFTRYHITGDRRGLDMAARWMTTMTTMGNHSKPDAPADCDAYRDYDKLAAIAAYRKENPGVKEEDLPKHMQEEMAKLRRFNPREVFVPLGELVQYYNSTWDPHALVMIRNYAEYLNPPITCTSSPSLSHFGKHWQDWYYELTRDPRVVDRITEYMTYLEGHGTAEDMVSFAAFLYHVKGETKYLKRGIGNVVDSTVNIYDYPGDRYANFNLAHSNPAAMLLGRLPYYLHAVDDAKMKFEHDKNRTVMVTRGGRMDTADKWLTRPRGWSNAGMTVLGLTDGKSPLGVRIDGPAQFGSFRGFYMLFAGFPELNMFNRPDVTNDRAYYDELKKQIITFDTENSYKDPPTQRNFSGRDGMPYIETPKHDVTNRKYRFEYSGDPVELPVFINAKSGEPFPQVGVISASHFWNNTVTDATFRNAGVSRLYFRPLHPYAKISLTVQSHKHRYPMPTTVKITDANGETVIDTAVFMAGNQKEITVQLDPSRHPIPWKLFLASSGDNRITFEGAPELFFALQPDDFEKVLPEIEVYEGK